MLQQTSLQNEHVMAAEWEKADNLQELDISATDLRCGPKRNETSIGHTDLNKAKIGFRPMRKLRL